ncbi:glycosyltransferase involved in cell wall biosynthesis [Ensifer adhaerens]|uniref:Glycosyltransferase involved in cell wall biosynthesis n=1 Tax=Ensifer adhaerens TaxID=106592 RepID=A0ACC5T098_ENSAD|nr:glycosyltransferase family 4 protein [Ensifer adhaerens]MBP1874551.1 glycosyltransferase involved in cell wall biosynthesis [Ensifer adhaerens]
MNMEYPLSNRPSPAPLRVLEVLEPSGGGSGRHFIDLCRGMHLRGHHVEAVYSPVRAEESFVRELKTVGLPAVHAVEMKRAPGPSDVPAFLALRRIMRHHGPFDIVHGHSSKAGALTRLRLPGRHVPRIYTPHAFRTLDPTLGRGGRLIYGAIEWGLAWFYTDHLICVSDDELCHAQSLHMPDERMSVIVNGVAPPSPDMAATIRASFGIAPDAFVYGFIGRLTAQKAPERLLAAFRHVAGSVKNSHLVMVGAGEIEGSLRQAISESGLQNRLHLTSAFTGPQAGPAFDVLVMPSRYEAMSYVMLEGAAAGKPIIATDIGGARTVIENGRNGFIVQNTDDVSELAKTMVAAAEPETFGKLTATARMLKDRFTLDVMLDSTEMLYWKLAERRRVRATV